MKRIWLYLSNTFENSTRKAFAKMLKIAKDHDSRLNGDKSDPAILALWNLFNPLLLAFINLYSQWQSSISTRISKTLILKDTFELLAKPWIREWQNKVNAVFPEDSPEDKAIFPQKKAPFQSANYEIRIEAVNTLATSLAPYPELVAVKTDVESKYERLATARDDQKRAMQSEEKALQDLEKQRVVLANALYRSLASLMVKYYEDPTLADRFFDLTLIRRTSTDSDATFSQSGQLNAETSAVVVVPKKFTLSIGANFIFANSGGGAELHCFFAASASDIDSPHKAIVLPGETVEITAGEMGWSAINTMLIVRNIGAVTAEYELTAIEAVG